MADLASAQDLEKTWRPLTGPEMTAAQVWIRRASAIVRQEVPSVDDRITAGTLDPDIVATVVEAMVRRVMSNPDGAKSMSETMHDYARSVTLADADAGTGLYLTDGERDRLTKTPTTRQSFTITPGGR